MTRHLTTLAVLILTALPVSTYSQTPDSVYVKHVVITTSLIDYLPTINLNTGNFNIGTEIYLKQRNFLYTNIGVIKSYGPSSGYFSISAQSTQGLKMQVEGRHYLNLHKIVEPTIFLFWPHIFQFNTQTLHNTGYYVAVNSSYQWTATDRQETVLDYISNTPFPNFEHRKQNIYTVNRNVVGLNMVFGYQCILNGGLTVDYAVGLGGRLISSRSKNRMGDDSDWPNSQQDFLSYKLFDKGTSFAPSFVYQFRLGWAFKKQDSMPKQS